MKKIILSLALIASVYGEGISTSKTTNATFQKECGSCHMAFQPSLLNQNSWTKVMGDLQNHFGVDASLEKVDQEAIAKYLKNNSNNRFKNPNNEIAITKMPWFTHEHNRFKERANKNPKIKTLSNCMACHINADKYGYDEDNVKIPK